MWVTNSRTPRLQALGERAVKIKIQLVYILFNLGFGMLAVAGWETLGVAGVVLWALVLSAINIYSATRQWKHNNSYIKLLEKVNRDYGKTLQIVSASRDRAEKELAEMRL